MCDRVSGAVVIVIGLYSVLWGKYKEEEEERMKMKLQERTSEAINDNYNTQVNGNIHLITENNEANGNSEMPKDEADKCPSVAINLPLSTKSTQ